MNFAIPSIPIDIKMHYYLIEYQVDDIFKRNKMQKIASRALPFVIFNLDELKFARL